MFGPPAPAAPLAALAAWLLAAGAGCGVTQRCRITPWFEVEHSRRVELLPGVALGEDSAAVRVLAGGQWVEVERRRGSSYHLTRDGVLLFLFDASGNAFEAQLFAPGGARPTTFPTPSCSRPVVLARQASILCWTCTASAGSDPFTGCGTAAFAELGLDGTGRWERSLALPVSAGGRACRIEELYGLSADGHPVVRLACPAPESARWIDPWTRTDVELRPDGFSELAPAAVPQPEHTLPWIDAHCPRWAPGP